jgi:phosphodiesterase/alkaline phosphatase D-like protein
MPYLGLGDPGVAAKQAAWLARDLAAVDRSATPWVIVAEHIPLYCSADDFAAAKATSAAIAAAKGGSGDGVDDVVDGGARDIRTGASSLTVQITAEHGILKKNILPESVF